MWYYLQSQLTQLKHELEAGSRSMKNANSNIDHFSLPSVVKHLNDVIDTGLDYKRCAVIFHVLLLIIINSSATLTCHQSVL